MTDLESTAHTSDISTNEYTGEDKSVFRSHGAENSNTEESVSRTTMLIRGNNDGESAEDDDNDNDKNNDDFDDDDHDDDNDDDLNKLRTNINVKHRPEEDDGKVVEQERDDVDTPLGIDHTWSTSLLPKNMTKQRQTKAKTTVHEPKIVFPEISEAMPQINDNGDEISLPTQTLRNTGMNQRNKSSVISERALNLSDSNIYSQAFVFKPIHGASKQSVSYRTPNFHQIKPIPPPMGFSKISIPGTNVLPLVFNDTLDDLQYYNKPNVCPVLEIRRSRKRSGNVSCIPREFPTKTCMKASKEYDLKSEPLKCGNESDHQLCSFKRVHQFSSQIKATIECDTAMCGENPVYVLEVSPVFGILKERPVWKRFLTSEGLAKYLERYANTSSTHGFNFCFLVCVGKERTGFIEQLFSFPSLHKFSGGRSQDTINFNVNILVLDSVSRPHFYRALPKAVRTLREIVHLESYNATVLDFEMMQSTAAYTFHNIRALMSGKKDFHYSGGHINESYGIDVLFGKFKKLGFYTLLQEDSCWYDSWGSLFTDNKYQGNPPIGKPGFAKRWKKFEEMVKYYNIDNFGLSHASCEVLKRYNTTNQFNHPRRVCFGGKAFAEHFLDYTESIYDILRTTGKTTRALTYTHLNIGHEISGTRIRQIDDRLSRYLEKMATTEDTLTVVLSDHGPKTTKYSFHTMEGRAEKYDPFLFIIIPEKVARELGLQTLRALVENQNRLVTTLDLHQAFMSLGKTSLTGRAGMTNRLSDKGIFGVIPASRTCADLSIKPLAVCKCEGWEKRFPDNDKRFTWLAEYALGNINNDIQKQYLIGVKHIRGYGNCQRLVGKRFSKIRQRSERGVTVTTMDIHVTPGYEIFEVQIQHSLRQSKHLSFITMTHRERITIYRHFTKCVDSTVSLGLCVCDHRSFHQSPTRRKRHKWVKITSRQDILDIIILSNSFGAETRIKDIHNGCLLLLYRNHESRSTSFEISNTCNDRTYSVAISVTNAGKYFLSRRTPFSILVRQRTIHFLLVVRRARKSKGNFKLKVSHTIKYLGQS